MPIDLYQNKWVYVLPAIHVSVCLLTYISMLIEPLNRLGIIYAFMLMLDLPISIVVFLIGFTYPLLAHIWILVVGTAWWYLLSRLTVGWLSNKFAARQPQTLFK